MSKEALTKAGEANMSASAVAASASRLADDKERVWSQPRYSLCSLAAQGRRGRHGVSECACYVALGLRTGHGSRVIANRVRDSTL